jgi:hypothetical protein
MSITQLSRSLMPFLQDFLFDGMRARLAPGRLLPHPRASAAPRNRRRRVAAPPWRARTRPQHRADRAAA